MPMVEPDPTPVTIDFDFALELLDVLSVTHIYTLLHSEHEEALGYDFKPYKWEGYELEHAQKSRETYRKLLEVMQASQDNKEN